MKTKEEVIKEAYGFFYEPNNDLINKKNGCVTKYIARKFQEKGLMMDECSVNKGYYLPLSISELNTNNGWIRIEREKLILPIDGTEVHFYHHFVNENGKQSEYHKGIFNAALGFTSYYDSEHYKITEVSHYQPIVKPKTPIY